MASIHAFTPRLIALDAARRMVRRIDYARRSVKDAGEARISRRSYDSQGRLSAAWDSRLFASGSSANERRWHGLRSTPIKVHHSDAGWRLSLFNSSNQRTEQWDAMGTSFRWVFDKNGRCIAAKEQAANAKERCAARFIFGVADDGAIAGRLHQCEDDAGRLVMHHGITGIRTSESRYFLRGLDLPDWATSDDDLEDKPSITRYCLDAVGQTSALINAAGHSEIRHRDVAGGLACVIFEIAGGRSKTVIAAVEYNADADVCGETLGNGMTTFCRFDPRNGVLMTMCRAVDGKTIHALSYDYDAASNVVSCESPVIPFAMAGRYPLRHRVELCV